MSIMQQMKAKAAWISIRSLLFIAVFRIVFFMCTFLQLSLQVTFLYNILCVLCVVCSWSSWVTVWTRWSLSWWAEHLWLCQKNTETILLGTYTTPCRDTPPTTWQKLSGTQLHKGFSLCPHPRLIVTTSHYSNSGFFCSSVPVLFSLGLEYKGHLLILLYSIIILCLKGWSI